MTTTFSEAALRPALTAAFEKISSREVRLDFEPGHQKLQVMLSDSGAPPISWYTQITSPLGKAAVWVGMRESERSEFEGWAMAVSGIEGDAFLRRVMSVFLVALGEKHEQAWSADAAEWSSTFPTDAELLNVGLSCQNIERIEFLIAFSPELSHPAKAQTVARNPAPVLSGAVQALLDVELPVLISFGSVEMQLKDVLRLSTGTMVELDHAVDDPVDIIVKNTVVARGQLVSVDGRYGVKIEELVSADRNASGPEGSSLHALASALSR
jgi:flagellar motor switch protein FliN/FliY